MDVPRLQFNKVVGTCRLSRLSAPQSARRGRGDSHHNVCNDRAWNKNVGSHPRRAMPQFCGETLIFLSITRRPTPHRLLARLLLSASHHLRILVEIAAAIAAREASRVGESA